MKNNRLSDELIVAQNELALQGEEMGKRAAERIIADKELAFQIEEKGKRAAELVIANQELLFQNAEKDKRAAELVIANMELLLQNEEKGRRAEELAATNLQLRKAEDNIRRLNEDLEKKVAARTAELNAVNADLEAFSYSVSHDLRAPLRSIHGFTRMLKEDLGTDLDPEIERMMNKIMDSASKMGQLMDDLLTFSRLGRKDIAKEDVPMFNIVSDLCREIEGQNPDRSINFDIAELPPAHGDCTVMKQVWANLISNAVKYSRLKEATHIEIGYEEAAGDLVYYIVDNGAGFDMRYVSKLFGVFHRLHSDQQFEGTGVGLAIVHRIITKHGGKVWADSKLHEGSRFSFSLPK